MLPKAAGFDWDDGNLEKCRKHGVSIAEIEAMFRRPVAIIPDPAHSRTEERFKVIGTSDGGRHIFVVIALRRRGGMFLIRPISARYMHGKEVRHYEEEIAKAQDR
jgi:uncharacterized DUF497 family protein